MKPESPITEQVFNFALSVAAGAICSKTRWLPYNGHLTNPLATGKLLFNASGKHINASAVEFREKWQTENDVIGRYRLEIDPAACTFREVGDPNGYLEKNINPYRKGLLGKFQNIPRYGVL